MLCRWTFVVGLLLAITLSLASPVPKREGVVSAAVGVEEESPRGLVLLSAVSPEELFGPELETRGGRDKRKLGWILDFIFWKFNTILDLKTRFLTAISTRSRARPATASASVTGASTEEPPVEFEGTRVSLVLPDELFGSAFTIITDVSKVIGSVILNSARRTQTFFEALKPIFRTAFGIRRSSSAVIESPSRGRGPPTSPSPASLPAAGGTPTDVSMTLPATTSSSADGENSEEKNET